MTLTSYSYSYSTLSKARKNPPDLSHFQTFVKQLDRWIKARDNVVSYGVYLPSVTPTRPDTAPTPPITLVGAAILSIGLHGLLLLLAFIKAEMEPPLPPIPKPLVAEIVTIVQTHEAAPSEPSPSPAAATVPPPPTPTTLPNDSTPSLASTQPKAQAPVAASPTPTKTSRPKRNIATKQRQAPASLIPPTDLPFSVTYTAPSPGNSTQGMNLERYTQLISLRFQEMLQRWLMAHKDKKRFFTKHQLTVRLHINRVGTITLVALERATPAANEKDIATAMHMMVESFPVHFPPVPEDYADEEELAFLIPVEM